MRDWGWQDRAEWSAQNGFGREEQRPRNHFGGTQKAPVWGEWEGVVEEHFGAVSWGWYVEKMKAVESRREERLWDEKVKILVPAIIGLTDEIGRTEAIEGALQRLLGRKPRSRVAMASAVLVSVWRSMTIEEILDDVRARIEAVHRSFFDTTEVVETRVSSVGVIPQNNPFAALKGKF